MHQLFKSHLIEQLDSIQSAGTHKSERIIDSTQSAHITLAGGQTVINMCANNYLGLADHPEVISAAHQSLDRWGYGAASVRFICGTQSLHKTLESRLSEFLGTEDTVLYSSCFDANAGLFETLLGADDAIISDELNHASIIDGIRLCKAKRFRYRNGDMADLAEKLQAATNDGARFKLIATDGVFSMDGYIAKLPDICELADRHQALVMVDDSHAVGFMGPKGRGTHELHGVMDRVDILTGTLGKALGGASGGYTSGRKEIIDLLRQRSRPYLFSNTLAPVIAGATLRVLDILSKSTELRDRLASNTQVFRHRMMENQFRILPGIHPITPVILGDARLASAFAEQMLKLGIYVVGFSYPVVPVGQARIRTQISAIHSESDLDAAVHAFVETRRILQLPTMSTEKS